VKIEPAVINTTYVLRELKDKKDDFVIAGDFARAMTTKSSTPHDEANIITSRPDVLVDLTRIIKTRQFQSIHNDPRYRKENAAMLEIVCSSFDEDIGEEEEPESFVTAEEEQQLDEAYTKYGYSLPPQGYKSSARMFIARNIRGMLAPSLAKVVYDLNVYDMHFRVHIVDDNLIEQYTDKAISEAKCLSCNRVALYPDDGLRFASDEVASDFANRIVRGGDRGEQNKAEYLITRCGWKYDESAVNKRRMTLDEVRSFAPNLGNGAPMYVMTTGTTATTTNW
jgi:hypothetical protein